MANNKKYIFVTDCDEVLRPLINNMVTVYNKHFNQNLTYDDIKDLDANTSFPLTAPNAHDWFFQEHGEEVYTMSAPIDKAVEALKILRKYGTVIIASYQPSIENKHWALDWFNKYGIEYDDVFFGGDKRQIICDFFIDDDPKYFLGSHAQYGIFINSCHNKNVDINDLKKTTYCKSIHKYNSIWEFASDFEKIMKKHGNV